MAISSFEKVHSIFLEISYTIESVSRIINVVNTQIILFNTTLGVPMAAASALVRLLHSL
jgi:hypothetical protein